MRRWNFCESIRSAFRNSGHRAMASDMMLASPVTGSLSAGKLMCSQTTSFVPWSPAQSASGSFASSSFE